MRGLRSSRRARTSRATSFDMRIAAFTAMCLAACAAVTPSPSIEAAASLAATETAFAAHSVREGMRAAFIAHFAPDGVFIREGWTAARAYLEPRPDPPIVLDWRPAFVLVAVSGELGLSTGPWKLTSKAKPEAAPAYGQFISIWRREGNEPWRVLADLGISHPAPDLWDSPLESGAVRTSGTGAAGSLASAEQRFADDARRSGLHAAYTSHASAKMRLYRNGKAPAIGREAIALVEDPGRPIAWTIERMGTARSADFGYALGRYSVADEAVSGYFLRVWIREDDRWRIALDVVNPPAPKPS